MSEDFEADVTFDPNEGLFTFVVDGHEEVEMTLRMPQNDKHSAAFDWMVSEATAIMIAGLNRLVDELENNEQASIVG